MTSIHFVSIGHDCSPATTLRNLGLRSKAFPFDWVQTNIHGIKQCLIDDFSQFHENISRMDHGRRMMDAYGFQYPHDYPLVGHSEEDDKSVGNGAFSEDLHRPIVNNWLLYYPTVKDKYNRRIQRFRELMNDRNIPICFLSRYPEMDAKYLLEFLRAHFKRNDLFMVNSCPDARQDQDLSTGLSSIWTEKHGIWNQSECWQEAINHLFEYHGISRAFL